MYTYRHCREMLDTLDGQAIIDHLETIAKLGTQDEDKTNKQTNKTQHRKLQI